MSTLSPVEFEVIRSRLLATTEEMRIALQSVSGSPTVTEASDFFTGLFLPDGSFASMGFQVSIQAPVVGYLIRAVADRPYHEVRDGDMFMGNDPFVGALHQNDLQLTGPIHADGQIIAWAGVEAHVTDIGGMDFASWSPRARDCRQEGLRIPCVKVVEQGRPREDIIGMILTATRLPAQLGLDIRAFIATINVARQRIGQLAGRYRADRVVEAMHRMIATSRKRMEARLLELPDGDFHAADFLEHDGEANRLYKIDVRMKKRGERLAFDFGGSSRQAPGFINCTRAGLYGAVAGSLLPMMAYDMPWNQGVMDVMDIAAPDGLVCTAQYPAPVGSATVETIWVVTNAVSAVLNKLLACSKAYAARAQAAATAPCRPSTWAGATSTASHSGCTSWMRWRVATRRSPARTATTPAARTTRRPPASPTWSATSRRCRYSTSIAASRVTRRVLEPSPAVFRPRCA